MKVSNELPGKEGAALWNVLAGLPNNNGLLTDVKRIFFKMELDVQRLPCQMDLCQKHHISQDCENILRK